MAFVNVSLLAALLQLSLNPRTKEVISPLSNHSCWANSSYSSNINAKVHTQTLTTGGFRPPLQGRKVLRKELTKWGNRHSMSTSFRRGSSPQYLIYVISTTPALHLELRLIACFRPNRPSPESTESSRAKPRPTSPGPTILWAAHS